MKEGAAKEDLLAENNKAAAVLVTAKAESEKIRLIGDATADAIATKGNAEAKVLKEKAEAFK